MKAFIVAATLLAIAGCRSQPKLDGARADIPVFAPSTMDMDDDPFGGYHTDGPKSMIDGTYWDLKTTASPEEVVAWYRAQLPAATVSVTTEDDDIRPRTVFRYVPAGFKDDYEENVRIAIDRQQAGGRTGIHIRQEVILVND